MTSSEPSQFRCYINQGIEEIGRIEVYDTESQWTFKFGIEGSNIGLFTVNVLKHRVSHLNFLGALEVALRELTVKQKNWREAGKPLEAKDA